VAGIAEAGAGPLPEKIVATELAASAQSWASWFYPGGAFTSDGRLIVIRDDYDTPQEIAILGPGPDQVLTSLAHAGTDYLRSVSGSAESVTWSAPDGTVIEGVVCTPAGAGPFPLVLHVHGGPIGAVQRNWAMRDYGVALLVSRGYAVLLPNPRGSSGRGQEFAAAVVGDMGGADTHDYLSGIDAMVERGPAWERRAGRAPHDGRQLRRVHVGLAGDPGPAVQGRGGRLAGDRVVQLHVHDQHLALGTVVPG
jgi:hypothetical protein